MVLEQVSGVIGALFQREHLEGSVKNRCVGVGHHPQHWGAQEGKQAWEGHGNINFGNLEVDT